MNIVISACSPPMCNCPELEITEDIDGNEIAIISDDFGGVCYMTRKEFEILAGKYFGGLLK